jgi:poly-gamma-glutamate synthesis protein (capsule biosynthesis protein)
LAFSDVGPGAIAVSQKQSGILIADTERIRRLVKSAHAKTDFLIVSYHFGNEYQATSTLRQKTLAHLAIDSGADAVVGSHPHVVQELETYHGKPIAYSLGNFVFDQYFSTSTMAGGVWHLLVSRHQVLDSKLQMANLNVAYQPSVH